MTTPDSPHVLLVAYDFPPIDSAGMQRIVSMAKYLSRDGWRVTVLTVRNSFVYRQSESSLEAIPEGVAVVRTSCFELRQAIARLRRWAFGADADAFGRGAAQGRSFRGRLIRPLVALLSRLDALTGFPDMKVGWFLPLYARAWRMLRSGDVDVVLSSSPPHSAHLPLLVLHRMKPFRWVVDFRDPWTVPQEARRNTARFRRERALERQVLGRADAIVANTPGNRDAIEEIFGPETGSKVTVITNGFDTDWTQRIQPCADHPVDGDLVYTGFIYRGMLDSYLDAIRHLHRRGERVPTLQVFGPPPAGLALDEETAPYISVHESVPYAQCLDIMRRAKALLLLVPYERETCVPSKLYPYLFSSTPVFALGPAGDAADIIERTGTGVLVHSRSPETIAAELTSFLDGASDAGHGGDVDAYSWPALSRRLERVLSAQLGGPSAAGEVAR